MGSTHFFAGVAAVACLWLMGCGSSGSSSAAPDTSSDGRSGSNSGALATDGSATHGDGSGSNSGALATDGAATHGDGSGSASGAPATDGAATHGDGSVGSGTPPELGIDPAMGWSSWSFIRHNPTEANIEAQATALSKSGLSSHGYIYINLDDCYYLDPATTVDSYGRWVVDKTTFPDGMKSVGDFVHGLGLKFGMYLTPGLPLAAAKQNTSIEGTSAHAAGIAVKSGSSYAFETNYHFGGSMVQIDYAQPGAQEFINSWANLLASYGVDYVKIDAMGSFDIPDVQAWSTALQQSGRFIHFELSASLPKSDGAIWSALANGWRIDGDIECNCPSTTSFPLTSWNNVQQRFSHLLGWQVFSHAGARNDPDSLDLGNGDNDGTTLDERKSQMSLWALSAAPLLLGSDLTNLDSGDLALMTNDEVIAVDQAGVPAQQIAGGTEQVWSATLPDGSLAVGVFNLGTASATITVSWSQLGLVGAATVRDLWAHSDLGSMTGVFSPTVPSHGVALVRITPSSGAASDGGACQSGESPKADSTSHDAGSICCPSVSTVLNCDGACVDTLMEPDNCGSCGNVCWQGSYCSSGQCVIDCTGALEHPSTVTNGTYVLTDSAGYLENAGSVVNQGSATGASSQWAITSLGNGGYKILGQGGTALTMTPFDTQLALQSYSGAPGQIWSFVQSGAGYYIFNPASCLDMGGGGEAGTPVGAYPYEGNATQLWTLANAQ